VKQIVGRARTLQQRRAERRRPDCLVQPNQQVFYRIKVSSGKKDLERSASETTEQGAQGVSLSKLFGGSIYLLNEGLHSSGIRLKSFKVAEMNSPDNVAIFEVKNRIAQPASSYRYLPG
jgi:hypothetical protein